MSGTLFIVSTPIGNLEDITLRAIRVLKEVTFIASEDTRRTKILLMAHGINTRLESFHSYSGGGKQARIIEQLLSGSNVALVSDSGTPTISDPGYSLVKECIKQKIQVTPIPGASACLAALVISGKPTDSFIFEGFLSNKDSRRKKEIEKLLQESRTVIVYESPYRIEKFLKDFYALAPEREVIIVRELTKKFEEKLRGTAKNILEHFAQEKPRGEFVVIF
ncbi:uroporphyrin-III C/tetrapyrrole (Corrin/Porphyrin) methyltransferase [Candidatus Omnitrophus magneticus]|uniref:Ribosomal RNA small subunit methyltransferase I n=1 Tax=Candidatus Omnitrophus magneticus TaxID=1609969 RepID=A0A0F0CSV6_9BACT|nr:uroporphyrin-III C/tetrapyrrole (Corrin/Porphyrin) methyltransferase [Candidatus Omnitrophus magneticus]